MSSQWDVAIAGAGPAGAIAAFTLARAGRRVLLVDDVKPGIRKVGESLPGAARALLQDLDLLDLIQQGPHLPCHSIASAWGSNDLAATELISDPHGQGWHLDRARFDEELRKAACDATATLKSGRVERCKLIGDRWHIELSNDEAHANWLVDATGRGARLARGLKAKRYRDDSLVAICAWTISRETGVESRTLVESTRDGWWYTAPLPGNTRVAVLHVDAEDARAILHVTKSWEAEVARSIHIRSALKDVTYLEGPRGVEACGARLDRFAGRRWIAAGDAALSFDPLSSQGLVNAIYTGMKAGQAVDLALKGDLSAVAAYATRLESIRTAYLARHRIAYQAERRWTDRPFWARRQSAV